MHLNGVPSNTHQKGGCFPIFCLERFVGVSQCVVYDVHVVIWQIETHHVLMCRTPNREEKLYN